MIDVCRIFDFTFLAAGASGSRNGRQIISRDAEDKRAEGGHGRRDGERGRFVERVVDGAAVNESAAAVLVEAFEPLDPRLDVAGVFIQVLVVILLAVVSTVVLLCSECQVLNLNEYCAE